MYCKYLGAACFRHKNKSREFLSPTALYVICLIDVAMVKWPSVPPPPFPKDMYDNEDLRFRLANYLFRLNLMRLKDAVTFIHYITSLSFWLLNTSSFSSWQVQEDMY
jgi:hypothetical protein